MAVLKQRLNKDMEKVGKSLKLCTNAFLMYLCEITGASNIFTGTWFSSAWFSNGSPFYYNVFSEFLRHDSQSVYSFGKIYVYIYIY